MPSSLAEPGYLLRTKRIMAEKMLSYTTFLRALLLPVVNVTGPFHRVCIQNCDSYWRKCYRRGSSQKAPVPGPHLWS